MKKETNVTFSGRLTALMSDRRLGNAALAKAVGISHVAVGNYLDGRLPRAEELLALAEYFGVSTDHLLGRDGVAPRTPTVPAADAGGRGEPGVSPGQLDSAMARLDEVRTRCAEAGELLERAMADLARIREELALRTSREGTPSSLPGGGVMKAKGSAGRVDLQGRRVSVKDTLPGVEAAVKDRVRDGALRAMRLSRGKGSPDKGSTAGTTGSKGGPSSGSAPA